MSEKVYKLSEEQSDLLMGDLGATLQKLSEVAGDNIELKESIEALKTTLVKEIKAANTLIGESHGTVKAEWESFLVQLSEKTKEVENLKRGYTDVMGESKEDFREMVKRFLNSKLGDLHLKTDGIQELIDSQMEEIVASVDLEKFKSAATKAAESAKKELGEIDLSEVKDITVSLKSTLAEIKKIEKSVSVVAKARAKMLEQALDDEIEEVQRVESEFIEETNTIIAEIKKEKDDLSKNNKKLEAALTEHKEKAESTLEDMNKTQEQYEKRFKQIERASCGKLNTMRGALAFFMGIVFWEVTTSIDVNDMVNTIRGIYSSMKGL